MTALYFGWPAFRNRHLLIWGGGGGGNPPIIFIPGRRFFIPGIVIFLFWTYLYMHRRQWW